MSLLRSGRRVLLALGLLAAARVAGAAGAAPPEAITDADLRKVFNADAGKVRLVLLFSPT